jgi:NADH-quinone oxidoreductase subunit N
VFMTAFPGLHDTWGPMVFWLAILTMVGANLVAVVQGNVKRMLAYSSIAHAGYLLVALAAASTAGAASYLFYLVVYTIMTLGSFAVVMVVAGPGERYLDLEAFGGLGWKRPVLGIAMTVFLLSLAGFPFTGGFIGKVYILSAAVERGLITLAVVLVLTSLVSYYYYLRVAWYMWFRDEPAGTIAGAREPEDARGMVRVALVASAVSIVLLGVYWGFLITWAEQSALALTGGASGLFGMGGP